MYLESAQRIPYTLDKMLSDTGDLYEDQCKVIIKDINQLDSNVKMPPSYDDFASIIGLQTQVGNLKNLLIEFSKTCPPGDNELRMELVDQIDITGKILIKLIRKKPYS